MATASPPSLRSRLRPSSTTASSSPILSTIRRPLPVILQFTNVFAHIGIAGSPSPHFSILLHPKLQEMLLLSNNNKNKHSSLRPHDYYTYLVPLLEEAYGRLGVDAPTRNIVLVGDLLMEHWNFRTGLECAVAEAGVPQMYRIPNLMNVLPTAVPHHPHVLCVHVTRITSTVGAHAHGLPLPFCQHTIPVGYRNVVNAENKDVLETAWTPLMDYHFLGISVSAANANNNNDNSNMLSSHALVGAILRTLYDAPRDVRMLLVQNILFCGEAVYFIPSLPGRVMQRVVQVLNGDDDETDDENQNETDAPSPPEQAPEDAADDDDAMHEIQYTNSPRSAIPHLRAELRPLASNITHLIRTKYRPDRIPWAAASLWTKAWHGRSNSSSSLHSNPATTASATTLMECPLRYVPPQLLDDPSEQVYENDDGNDE